MFAYDKNKDTPFWIGSIAHVIDKKLVMKKMKNLHYPETAPLVCFFWAGRNNSKMNGDFSFSFFILVLSYSTVPPVGLIWALPWDSPFKYVFFEQVEIIFIIFIIIIIIIIIIFHPLTSLSDSTSTWSYSLRATRNIIEVTFSKQWIHFRRSDLWPPTSTILIEIKMYISKFLEVRDNLYHIRAYHIHMYMIFIITLHSKFSVKFTSMMCQVRAVIKGR